MWMFSDNGGKKSRMKILLAVLVIVGIQFADNLIYVQDQVLSPNPTQAAEPTLKTGEVVIFAVASLTEPFREISKLFELSQPGAKVTYNFGESSALRTQLEQGAHADVLAFADTVQMDHAKKSGRIQGEARVFAANRLVVIVPQAKAEHITTFCDLGKPGVKLELAPANIPIGNYSRQAIAKASTECGADFEQRTLKNLVSEEENAKQVVTKVQLGEADAGIVYVTDVTAKVSNDVHTIPLNGDYNQIANYPIALTTIAKNRAIAESFIAFVLSPEGQVILGGYGFMPVKEKQLPEESE